MKEKFEYMEYNARSYESRLELYNHFGQEGWELVLIRGGNNLIFKRKIINQEVK